VKLPRRGQLELLTKGPLRNIVWKLDRLGRSLRDLITMLDDIKNRGVKFGHKRKLTPQPTTPKCSNNEKEANERRRSAARFEVNRSTLFRALAGATVTHWE
jgi:hypothetical protein